MLRANNVIKILVNDYNIDPSRLSSVTKGENDPLINTYNETNESNSIFGDIHQELEKNQNPWNFTYDKYVISKKDKYFNYIFK